MKTRSTLSAAIAVILTLTLCLAGCGVLDYLQLAIGAAEVALPLIPVGDPTTKAAVEQYLASASDAITKVADIEAGSGTAAQKAAQVAAALAGVISSVPQVPAQYQALAKAVGQVALYLEKFLAGLPAPSPTAAAAVSVQVSAKDEARLTAIKVRAKALRAKLR